ncbi:hypothetical protein BLNAU_18534 [Blattamonas nauphoetae]|uniref:Secreted protein n=1 Tax=Blattamonas nauphoetae TaxID=2049346 RepID=A0ABQ9X4N6_9EUKA|nr:hypothetical protein BLNAU_18534 [Blattamonas nauphoetae]
MFLSSTFPRTALGCSVAVSVCLSFLEKRTGLRIRCTDPSPAASLGTDLGLSRPSPVGGSAAASPRSRPHHSAAAISHSLSFAAHPQPRSNHPGCGSQMHE